MQDPLKSEKLLLIADELIAFVSVMFHVFDIMSHLPINPPCLHNLNRLILPDFVRMCAALILFSP